MEFKPEPFTSVLVANRGEIAVRIISAAKALGYRTIAVYSEADQNARHTDMADVAVAIGPAAAEASYLNIQAILAAAASSDAEAIHPGYGFLSENAAFASDCADANLVFIGPSPQAIELMGNKRLSKLAMVDAGVPCIAGYSGRDQRDKRLIEEIERIGFPVMLKAVAGGGGLGMRLLRSPADMHEGIAGARSEAVKAFGSGELIVEKAVLRARHIEIQIFADMHGNVIYLGERECSIQRRHQKIVEEAPSPLMDQDLRREMGNTAVQAARACDYLGAGTVEFLVDEEKNFHFLEMNTRLQVEHPVTECITGIDLVAWQFKVAQGETLPLTQADVSLNGHAIEARLYAEDPRNSFLPQTGKVLRWREVQRPYQRTDHMLREGAVITHHYDPLLAKLIAWGENREQARRRLLRMLDDTLLLGIKNNLYFLQRVIAHPLFRRGEVTTDFLPKHFTGDKSVQPFTIIHHQWALAAVIFHHLAAQQYAKPQRRYWSNTITSAAEYRLGCGEQEAVVNVDIEPCGTECAEGEQTENSIIYRVTINNIATTLTVLALNLHDCVYVVGGVRRRLPFVCERGDIVIDFPEGALHVVNLSKNTKLIADNTGSDQITAIMDGVIVDVLVRTEGMVSAGDTLIILEAMKMQYPLKAKYNGVVESLFTRVGDQVKAQQTLAVLKALDK